MIEFRGKHPDKYPHRDGVALSHACVVFREGVRESFAGTPDPLGCVRGVPGYVARRLIAADGGRILRVIVRSPEGFVVLGESSDEDTIRAEFYGNEDPGTPEAVAAAEASDGSDGGDGAADGAALADDAADGAAGDEGTAGAFVPTAEAFLAMTKAELVELAEAHGIEVDESARKAEIQAVVSEALGIDVASEGA